ncbi:MAG: glycoside hydrolase family 9 protein [Lachnospiraceae bacterium]|nr:glycoside hydrolase family 9 protein [Lachnospiraceae bacterium]
MNKKMVAGAIAIVCVGILIGFLIGRGSNKQVQTASSGEASQTSQDAREGQNADSNTQNTDAQAQNGADNNANSGEDKTQKLLAVNHNATLNTGNLTAKGNGYEGTEGTGKYNYGEALQKSLLFYELQRSGDLPEQVRCNWRGDSCLSDGSDVGLDLTGGWFDAGDHVKFNLPMAYTAAMLGWSVYEDKASYEESGQLEYALGNIRWANEYFIKCHPEDNVYYYQVGNGGADHSFWGPAEVVELATDRPAYKVTKDSPGSAVTAETAASLAVASIVFEKEDAAFSKECLKHAKSLFKFANDTRSDAGYTQANGFYDSHSGYYDELAWAGAWLYLATDDESYLKTAKECYTQANDDYNWALCWDDVHIGAALLLARITEDSTYTKAMEKHLDYWAGISDQHITYSPKGLAWLDNWGSLRYASTSAYVALLYSRWDGCPEKKADKYFDFAVSQANYILGDTGFSYLIGFGEDYPEHPHHRTAQGSYSNNMNEPSTHRHVLYGALVGGPDASDHYEDVVSNYNCNEVACDYNAGFTGLMAGLYSTYHGKTLKEFGAVEEPEAELYVEGGINVDGDDFLEIRAYVYNTTAWPARAGKDLEFRYYVDLTEVYDAGGTAENIAVSGNYMQNGSVGGLKVWDEDKHIYYLSVEFPDGAIYPGGQSQYKSELQVRMRNTGGVWDNSNDPSFEHMESGSLSAQTGMALYENGVLVYGKEPAQGKNAGQSITFKEGTASGQNNTGNGGAKVGTKNASGDDLDLSINYDNMTANSNSISGSMTIENKGDEIDLGDLAIEFYFTKDADKDLTFDCYYAAVSGQSSLSGVKGSFSKADGKDADTCCKITISDKGELKSGSTLTVNFSIHRTDWSNFNTSNDYSVSDAEHIVITDDGNVIFGTRP